MRGAMRWACTAVLALAIVALRAGAQEDRPPSLTCAIQARSLEIGVQLYAQKHGGKLPPDMYSAMEAYAASEGKTVEQIARTGMISPAHAEFLKAPKEITPGWVNEQSSYRYLGNSDVALDDVQDWSSVVIMHQRLEQGHAGTPTPENPTGEVFSLAFLDGHVITCGRAEAERLVSESSALLDSFRTGAPAPDDRQAVQNLALVMKAIRAYAKAHGGKLPADLGATLAYLPTGIKATETAERRARIYLSPRTRTTRSVPDEPTAEWVNANTWFVYLGSDELVLGDIPEEHEVALVHVRFDEAFTTPGVRGEAEERVPVGLVSGGASMKHVREAAWRVRESQKTLHAVQTGEALPDWIHLCRDVRVLGDAVRAYVKAHDGVLPADLGEVLEFIPEKIAGDRRADARVRVFLSPRAEATEVVPGALDAAWVRAHASYAYMSPAGAKVAELEGPTAMMSVLAPFEEAFRVEEQPREMLRVPVAGPTGGVWKAPREWIEEEIAKARKGMGK